MDPILLLLQRDSRTPLEDIARQLDLTLEEVAARVAAFEKNGLILGYQALVDSDRADSGMVTAFIEVRITPERDGGFDRLAARIAKFDQVRSCYLMSGGYDLLVVVQERDLREVAKFVTEKLSTIGGVLSTATRFQLKTYKIRGFLTIADEEGHDRLQVAP